MKPVASTLTRRRVGLAMFKQKPLKEMQKQLECLKRFAETQGSSTKPVDMTWTEHFQAEKVAEAPCVAEGHRDPGITHEAHGFHVDEATYGKFRLQTLEDVQKQLAGLKDNVETQATYGHVQAGAAEAAHAAEGHGRDPYTIDQFEAETASDVLRCAQKKSVSWTVLLTTGLYRTLCREKRVANVCTWSSTPMETFNTWRLIR